LHTAIAGLDKYKILLINKNPRPEARDLSGCIYHSLIPSDADGIRKKIDESQEFWKKIKIPDQKPGIYQGASTTSLYLRVFT
jgi:hypothetical protein